MIQVRNRTGASFRQISIRRVREVLNAVCKRIRRSDTSDIADVRVEIQKVLADPSGVLVQPVTTVEPRTRLRTILPWVAAAVVLGVIIAGVAVWNLKPTPPPEPRQVTRFYYELPKDQQFSDLSERALAVSPDGRQFVYSTSARALLALHGRTGCQTHSRN